MKINDRVKFTKNGSDFGVPANTEGKILKVEGNGFLVQFPRYEQGLIVSADAIELAEAEVAKTVKPEEKKAEK